MKTKIIIGISIFITILIIGTYLIVRESATTTTYKTKGNPVGWIAEQGYTKQTVDGYGEVVQGKDVAWHNYYQNLPQIVEPNTDYVLSVDYKIPHNPNNEHIFFTVAPGDDQWHGQPLLIKEVYGTVNNWQTMHIAFNSGTQIGVVVRVNAGSNNQTFYFNNPRITRLGNTKYVKADTRYLPKFASGSVVQITDAHQERICQEQADFYRWLDGNKGVIGEFGIPNDASNRKYKRLIELFYTSANAYKFDSFAWALGALWPKSYKGAPFIFDGNTFSNTAVSAVFSNQFNQKSKATITSGVNLSGAEFSLGNEATGNVSAELEVEYTYHSKGKIWQAIKELGINSVRYPIRLERVFDNAGNMQSQARSQLEAAMRKAQELGITVIIEPHNYATMQVDGAMHILGKSTEFSTSTYYKMMTNLAKFAKSQPAITGVGLMNEPYKLNKEEWEAISQSAVEAVRKAGFDGVIYVPVWGWQGIHKALEHNKPWIKDDGPYVYETHQYFDEDRSGTYKLTYKQDEYNIKASKSKKFIKTGYCILPNTKQTQSAHNAQ